LDLTSPQHTYSPFSHSQANSFFFSLFNSVSNTTGDARVT